MSICFVKQNNFAYGRSGAVLRFELLAALNMIISSRKFELTCLSSLFFLYSLREGYPRCGLYTDSARFFVLI